MAVIACARPDPVAISDTCTPVGPPVLIRQTAGDPGRWSLGLVDGSLLFSYVVYPGGDSPASARAQWFDASFAPTTDDFWLGDSRALPPFEWVAHDGAVWAQVWAERSATLGAIRTEIAVWRLAPNLTEPERFPVSLPITHALDGRLDVTPADVGATSVTAGADGRAPAVVAFGSPVFALTAIPWMCPGEPLTNFSRLVLFTQTTAQVDLSGSEPCALDGSVWAHDMRLVALRDGGLGVFFRLGISVGQGYLHYSRVGPDLALLDTPPRRVDETTYAWNIPGGFQPQAVALGSGTLFYTLRNPESTTSECQDLRLVEPDGTSARDAPYQMRCRPPHDGLRQMQNGPFLSQWVVVQPLASGHAVMAYGERTNYSPPGTEYVRRITASTPWEEGVFLHTIDEQGRRASEIVRVSAPESTATIGAATPRTDEDGPFPGEFEVQAISEGDDVVVVWNDRRPDAPGYYARRFQCAALEP